MSRMIALNRLRKRRECQHVVFPYRLSERMSRLIFRRRQRERNMARERNETLTDELSEKQNGPPRTLGAVFSRMKPFKSSLPALCGRSFS